MAVAGHRSDPVTCFQTRRGSDQGQVCEKNGYGRQLARVHAPQYHETLFSHLFPGRQESGSAYVPILKAMERWVDFTAAQKKRCILRSDGGFGGEPNANAALRAGWQILAKGKGGLRPQAFARRVAPEAWQDLGQQRWAAPVPHPPRYVRPTQQLVLHWLTEKGQDKYASLVCSVLDWSVPQLVDYYDDRGQCETEIQADKGGLKIAKRRKKRLAAQETLVLLTDLAHNLLAWTSRWMFPDPDPLAGFGTTRLTEDVLGLPGRLIFNNSRLVEVQLNQLHPLADHAARGLQRLLAHFGDP
jgi:hypothetical protein